MASTKIDLSASALSHAAALERGDYSALELNQAALDAAAAAQNLGAFLRLAPDLVLAQAREADERRRTGATRSPLDGIPVAIKDNICARGELCTCASRILENFVSPYDATAIARLRASGAVLFGRSNMDEFAMGSSTENSAYQPTRNPRAPDRVPGGSSGGSAAAVAANIVPLALGSDTGGSIRQPASFCGIVGLKPSYGRVSRYGLVAYASSLDQIGPFARTVEDAALLLSAISGSDPHDSTTHSEADRHAIQWKIPEITGAEWKKLRIGVFHKGETPPGLEPSVAERYLQTIKAFEDRGAAIVPLESALEEYLIPIYYILATAEASSNLSRYDGVRYGLRHSESSGLQDLYVRSRTAGFGPEVKRRILLGCFTLSSGYYDAYYKRAQQARRRIQQEYQDFFKKCDAILTPTSPGVAFRFGERTSDPIAMYRSDVLTIAANLAGVPAISVPAGQDAQGLPIGMQLIGSPFMENPLMRIARELAGFFVAPASAAPEKSPVNSPVKSPLKTTAQKMTAAQKPSEKKPSKKKTTAKKATATTPAKKKSGGAPSAGKKSEAAPTAKKKSAAGKKARQRRGPGR